MIYQLYALVGVDDGIMDCCCCSGYYYMVVVDSSIAVYYCYRYLCSNWRSYLLLLPPLLPLPLLQIQANFHATVVSDDIVAVAVVKKNWNSNSEVLNMKKMMMMVALPLLKLKPCYHHQHKRKEKIDLIRVGNCSSVSHHPRLY